MPSHMQSKRPPALLAFVVTFVQFAVGAAILATIYHHIPGWRW